MSDSRFTTPTPTNREQLEAEARRFAEWWQALGRLLGDDPFVVASAAWNAKTFGYSAQTESR